MPGGRLTNMINRYIIAPVTEYKGWPVASKTEQQYNQSFSMRTPRLTADSSLRDVGLELARIITGRSEVFDRDYRAEGVINFWLDCGIENAQDFDVKPLRSAILEIDSQSPWIDEALPFEEYESIRYLTSGETFTHRNCPPGWTVCCFFKITPYRNMRRNQIHAYERYLFNIGKKLAEKKMEGVLSVDVMPSWLSHQTFKS